MAYRALGSIFGWIFQPLCHVPGLGSALGRRRNPGIFRLRLCGTSEAVTAMASVGDAAEATSLWLGLQGLEFGGGAL